MKIKITENYSNITLNKTYKVIKTSKTKYYILKDNNRYEGIIKSACKIVKTYVNDNNNRVINVVGETNDL